MVEKKDAEIVDLAQFFNSVDFEIEFTGDWKKDEKAIYDKKFENGEY